MWRSSHISKTCNAHFPIFNLLCYSPQPTSLLFLVGGLNESWNMDETELPVLFPLSSSFGFHPLSFWFLISPEGKGRGWLDALPDSQGAMWPSMSSLTVPLHVQRRICLTSLDVSKIQMSVSRLCAWSSLSTKRKKQAWIKCNSPHPR